MSTPDNPNLAAALYHAGAGRPVFPCDPTNKRPAIAKRDGGNGFKDATTDETVIAAWWARYPEAVPGMPTGARVGVFVLDVDDKPGKCGRETLARLVATFGPLPETVETITATGGSHLFFRHPRDGRLVPNSASLLGQGSETWGRDGYPAVPFERSPGGKLVVPDLDIRGDGGYVILPGAVMADGRCYQWEGSSDPDEGAKVAVAPDWLLALVAHDPTAAPSAGAVVPAEGQRVGEGGRNEHLYRLGCSLRAKGLAESVIVAALLAENAERCDPPLPLPEVVASAKSAASKPPGLSPAFEERRAAAEARRAGHGAADPPTPASGRSRSETSGRGRRAKRRDESLSAPAAPSGGSDGPGSVEGGPPTPPPDDPGPGPMGGDGPTRPTIQIVDGELPAMTDDAEQYLIAGNAGIYQRGDQGLVRIATYTGVPPAGTARRDPGTIVIAEVTEPWLCDRMSRLIDWTRWDTRRSDLVRRDAPVKVASALLARGGDWRFPYLAGFCSAPFMTPAGRIVTAPGYDAQTALFLVDPPRIAPIGTIDRYHAERAGERLCELLGIGAPGPDGQMEPECFAFASPADQAAAMAQVMTGVLRPQLPTAPLHGVSASTPGSGKSLWVDVLAIIATGRRATCVNLGKDEEETEKRIGAQLGLGESFSFDNIEGAFSSPTLCTVATQESINVRILAQSRMARLPTAVNIWMTGNNLTPLKDLTRRGRILLARIDAGVERPELRTFQTDAIERAYANRAEAIRCCLIIAKAYLDSGCPEVSGPHTGGFRDWDRMVRFPLMAAGYPDPLGRAEDLREADHTLSGLALLLAAWRKARPLPCTAAELYEAIVETTPSFGGPPVLAHPDLHAAAVQIRGDPRKWTPRELGYVLREIQGRPLGGLKVVKASEKGRGGVVWEVRDA